MRVLLDTTALVQDPFLQSLGFKVLRAELPRLEWPLLVPAVVFNEAVNKYSERIESVARAVSKARDELRRYAPHDIDLLQQIEVRPLAEAYEKFLADALAELRATIVPFPTVTHERLSHLAMKKSKPFNESGCGYRDALVWYTIVEQLQADATPIAFVSHNSKDFGTPPSVHHELLDDLRISSRAEGVVLFGTIDEFNDKHVRPALAPLDAVARQLADGTFPGFSLQSWTASRLVRVIKRDDPGLETFDPTLTLPTIEDLTIESVTVDDVPGLGDEFLVSASADASVVLTSLARIDRDDAMRQYMGGEADEWTPATDSMRATIRFTLALSPTGAINDEVAAIDEIVTSQYGAARLRPHPIRGTGDKTTALPRRTLAPGVRRRKTPR